MKLTRAALLAAVGAIILSTGVAIARPGGGGGNGGGHGHPDRRPKVVANGVVTSVDVELGVGMFEVRKRGGSRRPVAVTILVDENTVFVRTDGEPSSVADVVEGAKVQAKGRRNPDKTVQATRVLIKVPEPEEEPAD